MCFIFNSIFKMYSMVMKLLELKNACTDFGLSTNGNKKELIARLNAHTAMSSEVEVAAPAPPLAVETTEVNEATQQVMLEDSDEELVNVPILHEKEDIYYRLEYDEKIQRSASRKRVRDDDDTVKTSGKRLRPVYLKERVFDTYEEATSHLYAENIWNKRTCIDTLEGKKHWWICKRCTKKCYILLHVTDMSVSIWSSTAEHQDVERTQAFGLSYTAKKQIDQLYMSGHTTASRILHVLRQRNEEILPKKMPSSKLFNSFFNVAQFLVLHPFILYYVNR